MFDTDELVINMGPQHPSTHGVLRVVLRLDGEKVIDADVVIGYLHRGVEKLSENRSWGQIILLTDRLDYVSAATSNRRLLRDGREADVDRGAAARASTFARSSASCSVLPATVSGSAHTRWTPAQ